MVSTTRDYAIERDRNDAIYALRDRFVWPTSDEGRKLVYLSGHSLGLQPEGARREVEMELDQWAQYGVRGHFEGQRPWYEYQDYFAESFANLAGANHSEVVAMNTLTTNLHLLFVSFYRPGPVRYKILTGAEVFPSDSHVANSQAEFHGLDPERAVVSVSGGGSLGCTTEDLLRAIEQHRSELAVVFVSAVHFLTGRALDLERISEAAAEAGAYIGVDLAHAMGNIDLALHDWGIDFAAWCSYKYLNGGPGAVGGCFVHERHANAEQMPRFEGWWGDDPESRFDTDSPFAGQSGAKGWQLSNPPVLSLAPLHASLELFERATLPNLREKSDALSGYMIDLLESIEGANIEILTPDSPRRRGAQVSFRCDEARQLHEYLSESGLVCDFREPNIIRAAAVPLYNSFEDVWQFWNATRRFFDAR